MRSEDNVVKDALNMAHQLGHAFGFGHDDAPENRIQHCDCGCTETGKCIMVTQLNTVRCLRLSNCSRETYYNLVRQGKGCLLNLPSRTARPKTCGNGVVDEREECDCGSDEECRRNSCCQKDCTLKMGTNCLYGLCCEKCKFSKRGTLCRQPATECDLPEFCNGSSADCPADVHKQDGMLCGTSDACYRGKCHNLQQHCAALFGQDADVAPLKCFREVNVQGDRSGNCGMKRGRFKKCPEKDILCGRIQCVHVNKIPTAEARQGVIQTPIENTVCWGTEFHLGDDTYDRGAVRDGTSCGAGKVCLNRSCVDRAVLNSDCDLARCNNRGVCNSNRNCHCSSGWAPPFCRSIGFGGSVDSGPPPDFRFTVESALAQMVSWGLFPKEMLAVLASPVGLPTLAHIKMRMPWVHSHNTFSPGS
ncbi:disintegrin and metalloproteinase domain-containing protein 30-like [Candoia aspera]|uniref:disintegrin and metalloproteinase domain-containing protein 30-like n=1 Tax=Candoia aspera TaxID=51853 RepID=UPI002FD7C57E